MSAIELPILVGVYENEPQAQRALDRLQQAGFNDQQIGMVMRNGGLLPINIKDTLVSIGVPEGEADIYQHELDIGHIIVLIRHGGRILEAFRCMFEITIKGASVSSQNQSQDQIETAHDSSPGSLFEKNSSRKDDTSTSNDAHSVWKLLKNAGLDHLL